MFKTKIKTKSFQKRFCIWAAMLLLGSTSTTRVWASSCDFSNTVLRNTIYGTAIGAGVGTLYMVATAASSDRLAPGIATSALVGAGAGFILGLVDLSYSGCFDKDRDRYDSYEKGLRIRPLVTVLNSDGPTLNLNQIGSGLTFTYFLER